MCALVKMGPIGDQYRADRQLRPIWTHSDMVTVLADWSRTTRLASLVESIGCKIVDQACGAQADSGLGCSQVIDTPDCLRRVVVAEPCSFDGKGRRTHMQRIDNCGSEATLEARDVALRGAS